MGFLPPTDWCTLWPMHTLFRLILLMVVALPAGAQPLYVDIDGVDPGDTLNIRAKPSGQAKIVGALPHDATMIEMTPAGPNGWGRIVWKDGDGWIAARFTRPSEVELENGIPRGLLCLGTEPFWSLRMNGTSAVFSDFDADPVPVDLIQPLTAVGQLWPRAFIHTGLNLVAISTVRPRGCSDDMSGRTYPWALDLLLQSAAGRELRSGCCYLPFDVGDN